MHSSILRTDLAPFHSILFEVFSGEVFSGLYRHHVTFRIFQIFGLSITEETKIVEMRIWCIKIGIV
jgi:hypothetical protein